MNKNKAEPILQTEEHDTEQGRTPSALAPPKRGRPINRAILVLGYGALLIVLTVLLARLMRDGGNPWQQGDWLINYGAGIVRRGLSGHLILGTSDWLRADPMLLLAVLQGTVTAAIIIGIAHASLRLGIPDRLLILLISPAFLPFWGYDFLGAMRKDMLALLAFLPLLAPAQSATGARLRGLLSLSIFALAVGFHEANAFLAPFLAAALWIAMPVGTPRHVYAGAAIALAMAAFVVALRYSTVDDAFAICRELTDRGLRPGLCRGAVDWLTLDLGRAVGEGQARIDAQGLPVTTLLSYALALMPVVIAVWPAPYRASAVAATLGSILLFSPLYVIALDWGRWIFLHISCLTLFLIVAASHRPLPWLYRPLPPNLFAFLISAAALWSMNFFTGETQPGLVFLLVNQTLALVAGAPGV